MSTISTLRVGAVGAVLALAMGAAAQTASARAEAPPQPGRAHSAVQAVEEETARAVAASLGDSAWRDGLRAAVRGGAEVDPGTLAARTPGAAAHRLAASVADGNARVLAAKGLDAATGPLLRLRLGDPSMRAALDAGTAPWVAAAPASDRATTLTAYDARGRAHVLDATQVPRQPVYLVDLDVTRALAGGAEILRRTLGGAAVRPQAAAADGWWGTKIDAIEVSDDEEPWFKGAAEMYALVTGFGTDGKVRVDPVDMPYLDYDGTVYRPNQILVNWSNYKYDLADVVLMEEDGSTDYQALAKAIAAVLLTVTDQGAYIPLVTAVLDAIPTEWWTDDPDYVDSWYTLARTSSGRLNGARGNGWMNVSPYWVSAF
ncbi:DUF3103 family protein [Streptomyces sp. NRRL B-24484]|uniref:DUF3103 family protein n=1 Tax=Streptomyces sp. NRRL B-24484 TaxID=1463833 RepID=UPI000AE8470D|nr:DUF3103 family protein [Streptomyces sp. NRRL B-24484]